MSLTYSDLKGPKTLPVLGNIHQIKLNDLHNQLEGWSNEFGTVFKLALKPPMIVVTDPEIIQVILKERPDDFLRMKKMDGVLREAGVHGLFNAEGEDWKVHRRVVAKGLDVNHQQQYFPAMITSLSRLYNKWKKNADGNSSFDVQKDLMRFTVDVSTTLAFGYEMNTLEQEGEVIQQEMEKIFPVIFSRINAPIPYWRLFKFKKDRDFDKALLKINELVDEFIASGKSKLIDNPELKVKPTNILEAMLVAAEEEKFTDHEIRSNLMTLLLAGEDTTALSVAWTIYLLCKHPEIQTKLQQEADEFIKSPATFMEDYQAVNSGLPYTTAVAMEAMRLKPVAPLLLFEATRDVEIKGYLFQKGSTILTQNRHGSMQPEYFENPTKFYPERWLIAREKRKSVGHNTDAYSPFGGGPRFCPGRNLAMLEMKLLISMMMKNFTIEMTTPMDDVKEIMAFTMGPSAYNIKLINRN